MIVSAGVPYQSPVATTKRTDDVRDKPDTPDRTDDTTTAEFAALMALIGGANSKVRTALLKQVPAGDSSLLDKLLQGATVDQTSATNAADAARYGMLLGKSAGNAATLASAAKSPSASADAASRISAEVLARIASRKPGSVENLLAIGDTDTAAAKAKLDALLASVGLNDAPSTAAANALAAALAASASNTTTPITATDGLDPEFRARLETVIARMREETGHEVSIVETVRSQERQDALFAQGRTTPGDVVTWTQDSAHTRGHAADVIVDGSWNNPKGFELLQRIAKEEGLRTLGAADPGHLEMPADAKTVSMKTIGTQTANSGVARVASVATVAPVASLGNATVTAVKSTAPAATTNNAPLSVMAQAARSSNSRSAQDDAAKDKSSEHDRTASAVKSDATDGIVLSETSRNSSHKFIGPVDTAEQATPVAGADGAERVQTIDALRERSSSGPMSQITLEVDGLNGDKQQITVDMRGNTVGANISTDAASADRMRARVGDLQGALEGHGLQVDTVHISSPSRATDTTEQVKQVSGDAIRMGGAGTSAGGEGNLQQGQRERSSATRDWEERQAAREQQRQNGKQAPQDRQRPQYQEKQ